MTQGADRGKITPKIKNYPNLYGISNYLINETLKL